MVNKGTSLMLNEADVKKCRELNINLSKEVRKYMKVLLGDVKQDVEITPDLEKQIELFVNDINSSELAKNSWRALIIGRCRLIYARTGIEIGPIQLEKEIITRLESESQKTEM